MRLLAITAAAVLTAAPAPVPDAEPAGDMPVVVPGGPTRSDCPETAATLARREGARLRPRVLGELPGADRYAAVYRRIDGCEVPLVTAYDIGGPSPASALDGRR
jgi:hypothetical protein